MTQETVGAKKPVIFVAARMTSSRLPGKMLMDFGSRPLLEHVVRAALAARGVGQVVVVTSDDQTDDPIACWCESNHVGIWRGELHDVAGRMLAAADSVGAESFVRISGDSPMIDPQLISFAVQKYAVARPDLVTNLRPRAFPAGQSVEVVRTQTLKQLLAAGGSLPEDREHVTPILYRHEKEIIVERFAPADIRSHTYTRRMPFKSMTVDTLEDALCFRRVLVSAECEDVWTLGWERCETLTRVAHRQIRSGLAGLDA